MFNKLKPFLWILCIAIIFLIGLYISLLNKTFLRTSEIYQENFILKVLQYDSEPMDIQTFNISQSNDKKFNAVSGTLIRGDEYVMKIKLKA